MRAGTVKPAVGTAIQLVGTGLQRSGTTSAGLADSTTRTLGPTTVQLALLGPDTAVTEIEAKPVTGIEAKPGIDCVVSVAPLGCVSILHHRLHSVALIRP